MSHFVQVMGNLGTSWNFSISNSSPGKSVSHEIVEDSHSPSIGRNGKIELQ